LVLLVSQREGAEFSPEGALAVPLAAGESVLELLNGVLEALAA
jgi:hypothetical protein